MNNTSDQTTLELGTLPSDDNSTQCEFPYQNNNLQDLPNEEWKRYPTSKYIWASNLGRIKLTPRPFKVNNTIKMSPLIIAKQYLNKKGYLKLMVNELGKLMSAHRIVAAAWHPNPEEKPQINHKNSIRTDNRIENVEWCTQEENFIHALLEGNHSKYGRNTPPKKQPPIVLYVYLHNGDLFKKYHTVKAAYTELGIASSTIAKHAKAQSYHAGFTFSTVPMENAPVNPLPQFKYQQVDENGKRITYIKKPESENQTLLRRKQVITTNISTGEEITHLSISDAAKYIGSKSKHLNRTIKTNGMSHNHKIRYANPEPPIISWIPVTQTKPYPNAKILFVDVTENQRIIHYGELHLIGQFYSISHNAYKYNVSHWAYLPKFPE